MDYTQWLEDMGRREQLREAIGRIVATSRPNRKGKFCNEPDCAEGCPQVYDTIMLAFDQALLDHAITRASGKTYEDLFGDVE